MRPPAWRRQKFDDCPPDPLPQRWAVEIALFLHQVGAFRRLQFSIRAMLANEQVRGTPDVEVRDRCCRPCGLLFGLQRDDIITRCHAIGPAGNSPLSKAPPFRTLHQWYPVENLVEALAEGIRTAHPAMPEFELGQRQIDDLITYLKSLEH
jgi:hypothetical protein